MVRISIPTLPPAPHVPPSALSLLPTHLAAAHLASFLEAGRGRTLLLTGAGVSVDSGIRAYRGKEGHYSNPNYQCVTWNRMMTCLIPAVDLYCTMSSSKTPKEGRCSGKCLDFLGGVWTFTD